MVVNKNYLIKELLKSDDTSFNNLIVTNSQHDYNILFSALDKLIEKYNVEYRIVTTKLFTYIDITHVYDNIDLNRKSVQQFPNNLIKQIHSSIIEVIEYFEQ